MAESFVVRGRIDTDTVYPRLEIRDISTATDEVTYQWSLFVLSWRAIQHPDETIKWTNIKASSILPPGGDFFSLGGVHGLPYERWPGDPASDRIVPPNPVHVLETVDNAAPTPKVPHEHAAKGADDDPITPGDENIRYGGYCNHGSILFPPWHRPYIMALEEAIGIVATKIAPEIAKLEMREMSREWIDAAKKLRFPYWDWTLEPEDPKQPVPAIFMQEQIEIFGPYARTSKVPNPLFCFDLSKYLGTERTRQFADVKNMEIPFSGGQTMTGYYRSWQRTVRWPLDQAEAKDQPDKMNHYYTERYKTLRDKVSSLFTFRSPTQENKTDWPRMWDKFSNTTQQSDPPVPNDPISNLESPHNLVHLIIGGVGHMGQNEYAGFDPLFYLHHCNVDRLYALWEWCYPEYRPAYGYSDKDSNVTHFLQPGGNYVTLPESRLDQWTDMLPWRKALGSYWTMDDVSWENRGKWNVFYTYPPVAGVDITKPAPDEKARAAARKALHDHFGLKVGEISNVITSPIFTVPDVDTIGGLPSRRTTIKNYRHFVIAVELSENLFNDSYYLELSYTAGGEDVWYGHAAVLTRPEDTPCEACQRRRAARTKVRDLIPIDAERVHNMLTARPNGVPMDATEESEVAYLKRLFKGRLVGRNGDVYAHTVSSDTEVSEAQRFPAELVPKLHFFTGYATISEELDKAEAPIEFFGHKNFNELFADAVWKIGPPPPPPPPPPPLPLPTDTPNPGY